MMWLRQLLFVCLASFLIGSCFAQTFQYSRGWTNGKRAFPLTQAGCELHRLRALLEGKTSPSDNSYLLCDLYRIPEEEMRVERLSKVQPRSTLAEDLVDN